MRRLLLTVLLSGLPGMAPLAAREAEAPGLPGPGHPPLPALVAGPPAPAPAADPAEPTDPLRWQPVWGLLGLRVTYGARMAPNGQKYHPSFSLDQNINCWLWPGQGLYLFGDLRFWGQRPEYGVTNQRDGGLGF